MDEKERKENEREREKLVPVSIIDVLLDPDNRDPVVLMGEDGKELKFEQVAVIPHDKEGEKRLYCILHPLTPIEGINDDEAIVFRCDFNAERRSLPLSLRSISACWIKRTSNDLFRAPMPDRNNTNRVPRPVCQTGIRHRKTR